jgi:phosphoribosyl-AMP cyclohydrolase
MSEKHKKIEEGLELTLDFEKISKVAKCGKDLIPATAQDIDTKEVLIVGYVNKKALEYALQNKKATWWSASRNELWIKGATSGEFLDLVETRVNCEQNSILYLVKVSSQGACHTKDANGIPRLGCYYRKITEKGDLEFVN